MKSVKQDVTSGEAKAEVEHQSLLRAFYHSVLFYPIRWYPGVGLLVALLPESLVAESSLLVQWVESAKAWIPAIASLGSISDLPTVTGLYLIVMWGLFPVAVWKMWSAYLSGVPSPRPPVLLSIGHILKVICMALVFIVAIGVFLFWFPFDLDERMRSPYGGRGALFIMTITGSGIGLGLGLAPFFWALVFIFMGWTLGLYLLIRKFIK